MFIKNINEIMSQAWLKKILNALPQGTGGYLIRSLFRMSIKTTRTSVIGASLVGALSLAMAVSGEFEAMLAWWMAILILLPPLLWALKTRYLTLKIICFLAFITQIVTLPFFYFNREAFTFVWGHVKPFGFTAVEALPMLSKVMLFLVCLIIFFKMLHRLHLFDRSSNPHSARFRLPSVQSKAMSFLAEKAHFFKPSRYSRFFGLLIVIIISVATPMNLWMFSQGISMVGVDPPNLPYRLSGILHYFAVFMVPLLLGILYWKSKQSFFLTMILFCYSWILGFTSISRFALIIVMLPIFTSAWLERRFLLLTFVGLGTVVGFAMVSSERRFVHIVTDGKAGADTGDGILTIITNILTEPDSPISDINFFLNTFVSIFDRIDGFGNLVMSNFYDPHAVLSPTGFLLRMIWRHFAPLDVDLHHIQWQGNILPIGFYNGGALLSNTIIIGNASLIWIVASALVTAGILVLLEKSAYRIIGRYGLNDSFASVIIGFLAIIFFIETGGSVTFVMPLLLLCIASVLPPLYRFNRPKSFVASAHSKYIGHGVLKMFSRSSTGMTLSPMPLTIRPADKDSASENNTSAKIIPRVFGGIGNQLFCYAAARRLALVNNAELVIDHVSGFAYDIDYQRHYQLDHFSIPCRKATAAERMEPFSRVRRMFKRKWNLLRMFAQRNYIQQESRDFDSRLLHIKPEGTVYLEGYWQSEDYFKDVERTLRQELQIKPPSDAANLLMAAKIRSCTAIAIHVRFFDQPQISGVNNTTSDYYTRAVALMERRVPSPHYFIFSDKLEAARARIPLPDARVTLVAQNQGDELAYADLWLMTQCHHFIIANSTFSWWGAWLAERADTLVISPRSVKGIITAWGFPGNLPSRWKTL